jgi:hypothetical protein
MTERPSDTTATATTATATASAKTGCEICAYASQHGHWPSSSPTRTHCRTCHRGWSSLREIHCVTCHRHFSSPSVLDYHLRTVGCVDPATVTRRDGRPRFVVRQRPHGETWYLAYYGERPAHWGKGEEKS